MYNEEKPHIVLFNLQYGGETSLLRPFVYIVFVRREPPWSCEDDKGIFFDVTQICSDLAWWWPWYKSPNATRLFLSKKDFLPIHKSYLVS
jgi:hypothetical protein